MDGCDKHSTSFLSRYSLTAEHLRKWRRKRFNSLIGLYAGGKLPVTTKCLVNLFHYYKRGEGPLLITGGVIRAPDRYSGLQFEDRSVTVEDKKLRQYFKGLVSLQPSQQNHFWKRHTGNSFPSNRFLIPIIFGILVKWCIRVTVTHQSTSSILVYPATKHIPVSSASGTQ